MRADIDVPASPTGIGPAEMEPGLAPIPSGGTTLVEELKITDVRVQEARKEVEAFTREIFNGEITVTEAEDPEIYDDRYFVIDVMDRGETAEILARFHEWHARLADLPPTVYGFFRLSIGLQQ